MRSIYKHKANWDETKERFNLWWQGTSLQRPMLNLNITKNNAVDVKSLEYSSLSDKYLNVEKQVYNYKNSLVNNSFLAEEFPNLNVVWGLPLIAEYYGAKPEYLEYTVWYEKFIDDYDTQYNNIKFDKNNSVLLKHFDMLKKAVELADEEFFITIPDLMERLDILAALRGSQELCFDFYDEPERVHKILLDYDNAHKYCYDKMYDIVKSPADMSSVWIAFNVWSQGRMAKLQCDFSAIMSPDQYDEFMLPGLIKQTQYLDNAFYHLDGKEAIIHLDSVLSVDKIQCLQWTPGDGQCDGGSEQWYPIYKKARAKNKGLWIYFKDGTINDGVKSADKLIKNIGPEGLYLHFLYDIDETTAKDLIHHAETKWSM